MQISCRPSKYTNHHLYDVYYGACAVMLATYRGVWKFYSGPQMKQKVCGHLYDETCAKMPPTASERKKNWQDRRRAGMQTWTLYRQDQLPLADLISGFMAGRACRFVGTHGWRRPPVSFLLTSKNPWNINIKNKRQWIVFSRVILVAFCSIKLNMQTPNQSGMDRWCIVQIHHLTEYSSQSTPKWSNNVEKARLGLTDGGDGCDDLP